MLCAESGCIALAVTGSPYCVVHRRRVYELRGQSDVRFLFQRFASSVNVEGRSAVEGSAVRGDQEQDDLPVEEPDRSSQK